jgi:cysteine desulfurase / selenocysteine lyase
MARAMSRSLKWQQAWYVNNDAVYLNAAGQAPMPRVSLEAVQASLEWKKFPQRLIDHQERDLSNCVRISLANLIRAKPEEIALTTGASAGLIALAYGLHWKQGDEILTAPREFPLQYTTWKPMEEREGIKLNLVAPAGRWVAAEDFIAALTPRTRLVSVSMVRFDDGSILDTSKLGAACHAQGTLLALDVSQCCGAIPMDVHTLGADLITCSGYKWLLGPYGSGFWWAKNELMASFRPVPFYWQGINGLNHFGELIFEDPKAAPGARGWDASETASYFNLAGWKASLRFLQDVGVETVAAHNQELMSHLYESLPRDQFLTTSPLETERRGPYACFAAHTQEQTQQAHARLKNERVIASLREGNIRVSTHLYNTMQDIDKLIEVIAG